MAEPTRPERMKISLRMEVLLTVDVEEGEDGPEVLRVRDVEFPTASEVMQTLCQERYGISDLERRFKMIRENS